MNAAQRRNLLKLAAYLEALPKGYQHFDMAWFADHRGECELPMDEEVYAATKPAEFLNNCGTVACAVGHGPAAGIPLTPDEIQKTFVNWHRYAERVFGSSAHGFGHAFSFLFGAEWTTIDNSHYGAAARIRFFVETREVAAAGAAAIKKYAPYRKGSRSAKRREIEMAAA